jgi:UDP-N-acetylmuramoylalanine-D-glutamate ligase
MAAARALAARTRPGAVAVWDAAADPRQQAGAAELRAQGIRVELGGEGLDLLDGTRTVVKSPGVPLDIPLLAEARRRGTTIVGEFEIGWQLVPAPTLGVTGTNGKSTVSGLCMEVLAAHGLEPVLAGNSESGPALSALALGPPPRSVVAEVSSFQAELATVLAVEAAVFTNLTPDHLTRHGTMEAYGEAKRRLFLRDGFVVPLAVLNCDDPLGCRLAAEIESRGGRATRYGHDAAADYRIVGCEWGLREAEVEIACPGGPMRLQTRLPGLHNAANAVAALALADGLGLSREASVAALATAPGVPGRFESVEVDRPFDVIVDLGYTADSIGKTLAAARGVVAARKGRLLTVLAVVGRIGPTVGPDSAAMARRCSDHLILSGTSYYGEARLVTLAAMLRGARAAPGCEYEVVIDRAAAIRKALAMARPGDLVAVLGRGPTAREATDLRGGYRPLDDRDVVREFA